MAKIRNAKPKASSGGYTRVFDNEVLGTLIQKVQSTVISNGTELEKLIIKNAVIIEDLDRFIEDVQEGKKAQGVYLCQKKTIKRSRYNLDKHEPDIIVFQLRPGAGLCYIIELKDGDAFDTKKSDGELESLRLYQNHLGAKIPFVTNYFICAFNQTDKKVIVEGFKKRFSEEQVMTGEELCRILGIDYEAIVSRRKADAPDNVDFFVDELSKIPVVVAELHKKSLQHISDDDFYEEE